MVRSIRICSPFASILLRWLWEERVDGAVGGILQSQSRHHLLPATHSRSSTSLSTAMSASADAPHWLNVTISS